MRHRRMGHADEGIAAMQGSVEMHCSIQQGTSMQENVMTCLLYKVQRRRIRSASKNRSPLCILMIDCCISRTPEKRSV
jgi:hypothetical protein